MFQINQGTIICCYRLRLMRNYGLSLKNPYFWDLGYKITVFRIFWTSNYYKHFQKQPKSTLAIEWCMNCHICMKKHFGQFSRGGGPSQKLNRKFFLHRNMTIHTPFDSPCRVYKKLVVFGNFYSDYWSKKS
jgi:hypothetical protein